MLWETNATIKFEDDNQKHLQDSEQTLPEVLKPISTEEKKKFVKEYLEEVDPQSTVYGCASCGVWVIRTKDEGPLERVLCEMSNLELTQEESIVYWNADHFYRRTKSIVISERENGKRIVMYQLYRQFLTIPFENEEEFFQHMDDVKASAWLCKSCYDYTTPAAVKANKKPPFSISSGVDYGTGFYTMPRLNFLEKMLLQRYHVFAHVFKVSSGLTQAGLRGSVVALRTSAYDISSAKQKLVDEETDVTKELLLPQDNFSISIQFLGKMQTWQRIKSEEAAQLEFITLFGKIFIVDSDNLKPWLLYMKHQFPTFNIVLDEHRLEQTHLDSMVKTLFKESTAHGINEMTTVIEEQARLNVPGAAEGSDVQNGVEFNFVVEEENIQEEQAEENIRKEILTSFLHMLPKEEKTSTESAVNEPPIYGISYDQDAIANEYSQCKEMMEGLFPWLFPNGYPYKGALRENELKHMLNQASNAFSSEATFVFLCFDMLRRRSVSRGVHAVFKNDPESIEELTEALNDPNFMRDLKEAIATPKSDLGKGMEKWMNTVVHRSAKNVPFAASRSSAAFSEMLAMNRYIE